MADTSGPEGFFSFGAALATRRARAVSAGCWAALLCGVAVLAGVAATPARAQQKAKTKLLFLVARVEIADPMFEHSVVLMLPSQDGPLIVGLIVNKPTRLSLLKIFPESPALKNHAGNAYIGGPVDMETPALAFHASKPPKKAMPLYDDVYLTFDEELISALMSDPKQSGEVRLFLGRAQWAPEQLRGEDLEGSWYGLRAEGDLIFDPDSEHLWNRLHTRARPPFSVENRRAQPFAARLRVGETCFPPYSLALLRSRDL